jgi:hypothetical protein
MKTTTVVPYGSLMSAKMAGTLAFVWWGLIRCVTDLFSHGFVSLSFLRDIIASGLALAVARFAFSARSRGGIARRLAWCTWLLFLAEALVEGVRRLPYQDGHAAVVGGMVAVSAVVTGGLVAAYSWVLGRLMGRHLEATSREGDDRAQIVAGTWAMVAQLPMLLTLLAGLAMKSRYPALQEAWAALVVARAFAITALGVGVPAAFVIGARARIRARRRWLGRVGAGELPHWRIVERASPGERIPHLVDVGQGPTATLVRVHEAEQPFRETETEEPIALVACSKTSASA